MEISKLSLAAANQPVSSAASVSENGGFVSTVLDKLKVPSNLESIFEEASRRYQVPSVLLKAVAKAESSFNPQAVSHCGARGVMQLMPGTAKSLGVTDSFDPWQNIMGGSKYLSNLLSNYNGNVKLALAAYNAGSGNVDKYGGIPPFTETQNYVRKVMGYLDGSTEFVSGPTVYRQTASEGDKRARYTESAGSVLSSTFSSGQELTGGSGGLMSLILQSLMGYKDFTEDDYLILLDMMKLKMYNSTAASLSLTDEDYSREALINTGRLQYI